MFFVNGCCSIIANTHVVRLIEAVHMISASPRLGGFVIGHSVITHYITRLYQVHRCRWFHERADCPELLVQHRSNSTTVANPKHHVPQTPF